MKAYSVAVLCGLLLFCAVLFGSEREEVLSASEIKTGMFVHINFASSELMADMARSGQFLVHGLSADAKAVADARAALQTQNLYGRAAVEQMASGGLPYADNLINLLVADNLPQNAAGGISVQEVARVLCPGGVALVRAPDAAALGAGFTAGANGWARYTKAAPPGNDEWTHDRHGPDGNLVSQDKCGVPNSLRWIAGPAWPTGHRQSSMAAQATSEGRIFYYICGAPLDANNNRMSIVARDAYNGMLLWERVWKGRSHGPIVSLGGRVYAPIEGKVAALDAATGKTLLEYECEPPTRLLLEQNVFVASTAKDIRAFEPLTGKLLWKQDIEAVDLISANGKLFFMDAAAQPYQLHCLDLNTGRKIWAASTQSFWPEKAVRSRGRPLQLRLCKYDVLVFRHVGMIHGVSPEDGRHLWKAVCQDDDHAPAGSQALALQGLIWVPATGYKVFTWMGLDPLTGAEKRRVNIRLPGCGRNIATEDNFIAKLGVFTDTTTGTAQRIGVIRAGCWVGMMPANGLIYTHSHSCQCAAASNVFGFIAAARETGPAAVVQDAATRLQTGPAFGQASSSAPANNPQDWPTFRHDRARSGASSTEISPELRLLWEKPLTVWAGQPRAEFSLTALQPIFEGLALHPIINGGLTSPVVAAGKVFVALPDVHQVKALDAESGRELWTFTAGSRIDSPPTIEGGLCLFGCRDGWVYCLSAANGQLAWRFRVAQYERRIPVFSQLESPWPVCGSVLAGDGLVHAASGWVDSNGSGGITLAALEANTGKLLWEKQPGGYSHNTVLAANGENICLSSSPYVYLSDLNRSKIKLVDARTAQVTQIPEAKVVFLRGFPFGLLHNSWTRYDLAYRKYMAEWRDGRGGIGQLLVPAADRTFGYNIKDAKGAKIFCRQVDAAGKLLKENTWSVDLPKGLQIEALTLAGKHLLAAGPTSRTDRNGGFVWVLSAADGSKLQELKLDSPPAYDGFAVAGGRVYLAAQSGKLFCFGAP